MSFLQPWLLAALPVIALPIVIHLINQRRYQTIQWAAMMFLAAASRMSRGYARLRQWLILLFRMAAIAGLIFAVSRPLASGWLGVAGGGRADTTMILLDRSPSMQEERQGAVGSKLETGRQQLVRTLGTLGSARWVLIESATSTPLELESPEELLRLPAVEPTSAAADLPAMLQAAHEYMETNRTGRTEIWICSDLRENDWNASDGRWQALREVFSRAEQGVRFHLLAYPESAPQNISVRVTDVRRRETADAAELLVSLSLARGSAGPAAAPGGGAERLSIPVQLEIEGARSEVTLEMVGSQLEIRDHRIPLDRDRRRGWGRVSIPADANPADNDFYFVFDQPVARRTVVVAEDALAADPLRLAAAISPDPALPCAAEVIAPEQLPIAEWEDASLLLWQAPLPARELGKRVEAFVERGGVVLFLPPRAPTTDEIAGLRWGAWQEAPDGLRIATWRGDQDLLAHTQSGAALPLGDLVIRKHCALAGEHTPLGALKGGAPFLARAATTRGAMYFCATTPAPADSSLSSNGIVLYVLVQRALAAGAAARGSTRQLIAGAQSVSSDKALSWRQVTGTPAALSTEYAFHAGVYAAGEKLLAVNPAPAEGHAPPLSDQRVGALFQGLDFARVDDQAGSLAALINEIWRPFLAAMIAALIIEAILCLPRITPGAAAPAGATR